MTPAQLYDTTPIEFDYCLQTFFTDRRDDWERTRLQTFILFSATAGSSDSTLKPKELMPFPWDEEEIEEVEVIEIDWTEYDKKYTGGH